MIVGKVVWGKFGEICIRQHSNQAIELGELLIADTSEQKILLHIFDLQYGSQLSTQKRELISGMELEEDHDFELMEPHLRNYKLAMAKNVLAIDIKNAAACKILPEFLSSVRTATKEDFAFLDAPKAPLYLGHIRSGSKIIDVPLYLDGEQVLAHHILIPASTGKGKSLDGEEEVLIFKDGKYIMKTIAEIVNNRAIYEGSRALTMNPQNCATEFKKISDFVKHKSPKYMYHVVTEGGREVIVTGDHNLHVLRNGKLMLLETEKITEKDYLPIPEKIPEIGNLVEINIWDLLKENNKVYVQWNDDLKKRLKPREQCIEILSKYYARPIVHYREIISKQNKIKICLLLELLQSQPNTNELRKISLTDRFQSLVLKAICPISEAFLELLGYYIAEGYYFGNCLRISASESPIQKHLEAILQRLNLNYFWVAKKKTNADLGISSTILIQLLKNLGSGRVSGDKRLPQFWMNLSNKNIKILLRTYFEGDGGADILTKKINRNFRISTTTKSKLLAHDLCMALSRFGVYGRIKKIWKKATNTSHKGNYYYQINIAGRDNMNLFLKEIGCKHSRKNNVLESRLGYKGNTNIDVIPVNPTEFIKARAAAGFGQGAFAKKVSCSQSQISLIELGKRRPSRSLMKEFVSKFKEFNVFSHLLDARWEKIKEIKKVKYDKKEVYDLTIEDNHTFLAGHGGLFVHNSNLLSCLLWDSMSQDYGAFLVLDPHDEYYGRHKKGLKDHGAGRLIYYSPSDVPPGERSLVINLSLLKPQHFDGTYPWTSAQKEAMAIAYKQDQNNWIKNILLDLLPENFIHEGTLGVVKRRLSHMLDVQKEGAQLICNGIFKQEGGETTIKDIVGSLEQGKTVIVNTAHFSSPVEILIGSLCARELLSTYQYYSAKGLLAEKPVISIVLEEAPRVLGKDVLEHGPNIFSTIAREGRKFKIGLTAITQLPSLIPKEILANMNTKIILGIEMKPERQSIIESAAQDLSEDNRTIASLGKGEAIVTSIFSRFAVPIKIPLFENHSLRGEKTRQTTLNLSGVKSG